MPNSKNGTPVRIRHVEFGSVYRIIRVAVRGKDLYFICRDESDYVRPGHKGEIVWISVDSWATGEWVTV